MQCKNDVLCIINLIHSPLAPTPTYVCFAFFYTDAIMGIRGDRLGAIDEGAMW